jgi:putative ABC transport system ATP-binding protein
MPELPLRLMSLTLAIRDGTSEELRALDGVDLDLEQGSFTVVLGTNGSGKSSLLNVIAGSVLPSAGTVTMDGRDVTSWPAHRRADAIGRVFQNPFAGTAPELTVAENLALAAKRGRRRRLGRALGRERRLALRDAVAGLGMGLEDRMDVPIGRLSGGQRQAITVLMATQVVPSVLLLDEHTAALDPRSADVVVEITRRIVQEEALTTLMVTHSLGQASQLGDRILLMHRGRIAYDLRGLRRSALREADLLHLFDELRWADGLDPSATRMLERMWV